MAAKVGGWLPDDEFAILMGLRVTYVDISKSTKPSPRTFMTIEFVSPDVGFVLGAQAKSTNAVPNPLGELADRLASIYYSASTWTAHITAKQTSYVDVTYTLGFEYQISVTGDPDLIRIVSSVGLEKPGNHVLPTFGVRAKIGGIEYYVVFTHQPDPKGNDVYLGLGIGL